MGSDLTEEACRLEVRLLDRKVRSQPSLVAELLHEDFIEYGSSGRRWTRDEIVNELSTEGGASRIATFDLTASELADNVALVTYRSSRDGREAWRSSIWIREDGRCRILLHQATPVAPIDI
ncbi:nuclear transport factor 2 family protein [Ilumatobacter nonamiensis]|uniref:nuclear transport factor 2 family protein n=1 Tax=Ilumatobacter nonamiensis TaxID=467093 RepID=UPI0006879EBA|nr:nuclear transport factor 2 family protein [Ilumatobacter nonamiensis]